MSGGPEFFQTGMGHSFFNGTLPRLVRALERIADELEARRKRDEELAKNEGS